MRTTLWRWVAVGILIGSALTSSVWAGTQDVKIPNHPRPKDLDPRIEWLSDLGLPRSSGPEPMGIVQRYTLPTRRFLLNLTAAQNGVAAVLGVVGEAGSCVALFGDGGTLRWERPLPEWSLWSVAADDRRICVVPTRSYRGLENAQYTAYAFDYAGIVLNTWPWPFAGPADTTHELVLREGVLVGEFEFDQHGGHRVGIKVDPSSHADPQTIADGVVTKNDLQLDVVMQAADDPQRNRKSPKWSDGVVGLMASLVFAGGTAPARVALRAQRAARVRGWNGRRLKVAELPWYRRGVTGRDPGASLAPGDPLSLSTDGTIAMNFLLRNPFGLSAGEFWDKHTDRSLRGRRIVVWFDDRGEPLSCLVDPPRPYFVIGRNLFTIRDSGRFGEGQTMQRWGPLGR